MEIIQPYFETASVLLQQTQLSSTYWIIGVLVCIYAIYYKMFHYYTPIEKQGWTFERGNRPRGTPPPSYPNGWYRILDSHELKAGDTRSINVAGRHIAVFRGQDKKAYAMEAFCPHMGADLGHGGRVKWNNCIECPFHGWTFDGATGKVVDNEEKTVEKKTSLYEYDDIRKMPKKEGKFLHKRCEQKTQQKIFPVCEKNNNIYVWIHSREELRWEPFYQIPDVTNSVYGAPLSLRGQSVDYMNCHIQEIPENGADYKHFEFVHFTLVGFLLPWVKFKWVGKDRRPSDPDFQEVIGQHWNPKVQAYQKKLFERHLQDKSQLPYINCLVLDSYLRVFNYDIYLLTATAFQIGSSTVFLYMRFPFYEIVFVQGLMPIAKATIAAFHKVYATWWLPYFVTVLSITMFRRQLIVDKLIWNNKTMIKSVRYNESSYADQRLISWRNWFSQYYDGCDEFEKINNENGLNW